MSRRRLQQRRGKSPDARKRQQRDQALLALGDPGATIRYADQILGLVLEPLARSLERKLPPGTKIVSVDSILHDVVNVTARVMPVKPLDFITMDLVLDKPKP